MEAVSIFNLYVTATAVGFFNSHRSRYRRQHHAARQRAGEKIAAGMPGALDDVAAMMFLVSLRDDPQAMETAFWQGRAMVQRLYGLDLTPAAAAEGLREFVEKQADKWEARWAGSEDGAAWGK